MTDSHIAYVRFLARGDSHCSSILLHIFFFFKYPCCYSFFQSVCRNRLSGLLAPLLLVASISQIALQGHFGSKVLS